MKTMIKISLFVFGLIQMVSAVEDEGKVLEIWSIGDSDANTSIRGQVQVFLGDQFHWYFIPSSDVNQKNMLAILLSAQAQDRTVKLTLTGGIGTQIQRVVIK